MDRRHFLFGAGAAGAALAIPAAAARKRPAAASAASDRGIRIDAQGGVDDWEPAFEGRYVPDPRVVEAIRQGRIHVVSVTHGNVGNGPDRFRDLVETVATTDRLIAAYPTLFAKIESVADIRRARAAKRLGVICNVQDTTFLEADPRRVEVLSTLGVKVMQLTYNKRNLAGDGALERANAGLSDFGREVIARINSANVLLDLSHGGQRTIAEGIAESKAPPAITHSGCRALVDFPRNTWDSEMRALADKGGVFGVYLMPFLRPKGQAVREDLLRHLDHALKVCGEDHVGIGTDGPVAGVTIDDKARKAQRDFYEARAKAGIAAPGEAADVFNIVEGYNDPARYDRIAEDLKARGWTAAQVDKLLGGNWMRLFGEVWRG
jgi:membrane dipeptidase